MKKLILSSAGIFEETNKDNLRYFLDFINKDLNGLKMALIPTAGYPVIKKKYIKQIINAANKYGINTKVIDLKEESSKTLELKLKDVDILYVNGGNSFWLLKWVRKSDFDKIVKKLINKGKIYIGVSAGSYIACPTIEMARWKHLDDPQIIKESDLTALNLVDFLITAHYEDKYKKAVEDGAKTTSLPVIALTDKQAIVVNNDKLKIIGPKKVLSLNNFQL